MACSENVAGTKLHLRNTSGFCVDHSLVDTRDRQGMVGRQTRMLGVNKTARGNVLSLYGTNAVICLCVCVFGTNILYIYLCETNALHTNESHCYFTVYAG